MAIRELELKFMNAMHELQTSFVKHHQIWRENYQALQNLLEQSKAREATLQEQNDLLLEKLNTATSLPEQHVLVKQIKMLDTHLDILATDIALFNRDLDGKHAKSGNFSSDS